MAGAGRLPKDPRLRQRMNKTSTRAVLPETGPTPAQMPKLPKRAADARPWHPETVIYWSEVWTSPESTQWSVADRGQILVMFLVLDDLHHGNLDRAAEVRLQAARFGLDVMARRRLQWEREQEATKPQAPPVRTGTDDPRKVLRMVSK